MKVSKGPEGSTITRWLDQRTVEITFEGKISQAGVEQMVKDFAEVAGARPVPYVLIDTSGVNGFTAAIRNGAVRFLSEFKIRGGREFLGIANMGSLRMFAQALSFATGLPLKLFPDREHALNYIIKKMKED